MEDFGLAGGAITASTGVQDTRSMITDIDDRFIIGDPPLTVTRRIFVDSEPMSVGKSLPLWKTSLSETLPSNSGTLARNSFKW